ncbi:Dps family protein [Pedomonas mirosovicensis]|uniref:Dps family protein n=1 Tax=Pedomonas mirosovicensis TaxID=2908641 RepID=UPI00216936BC|nr:DNA starvation/stationary phase protection protein [Pedomonas mirosovicensis]MCH8683849.1 DNA starvation/stationary phase protection protein [Pedomonas mirosovicensis]
MATPEMKETLEIGLTAEARAKVVGILNRLLADEFSLYARARAFHWNVTGRHFKQDHALFEEEYEALDETIDEVAERARSLGGTVQATLSQYVQNRTIPEVDSTELTSEQMIASMRDGHEALARQLREDIHAADEVGDEGTADFLTALLEAHEKRAWMLRSHLA